MNRSDADDVSFVTSESHEKRRRGTSYTTNAKNRWGGMERHRRISGVTHFLEVRSEHGRRRRIRACSAWWRRRRRAENGPGWHAVSWAVRRADPFFLFPKGFFVRSRPLGTLLLCHFFRQGQGAVLPEKKLRFRSLTRANRPKDRRPPKVFFSRCRLVFVL